jgi:hypothetical protein
MNFFRQIPEILSQFTKAQKILALVLLLFSIIIIVVSPSLISAITLDREELTNSINDKDIKINRLNSQINSLDSTIRSNQKYCTNTIIERETEFVQMLEDLKKDAKKMDNILSRKIEKNSTPLYVIEDTLAPLAKQMLREEPLPQVNGLLVDKIGKMQEKIKAH